ncbi:MAG TPA: serine/threonine-protein kinase [Planctomycetia bacterium]|nr:serine/threonine-protein kinase [Planctomycetia bacterium]
MSRPVDRTLAIFSAAAELPAGERKDFAARECGDDVETRRRVESLLAAYADASAGAANTVVQSGVTDADSGERPAPENTYYPEDPAATFVSSEAIAMKAAATARPGYIAGRYRLIESLGEGGMGSVLLAEQEEPVRRMVAVKVIKAGMDTKSVLARFDTERQALAMMDHPCIAKVFDGGVTENGRPYFVMEYVDGAPLNEYCHAKELDVPARLRLFIQICHAVQHAHQKGIIHRDLKPTNILIAEADGRPTPKVIDFGLAKAMHDEHADRTMLTVATKALGTPLYMSPEQAGSGDLDVDTRSDIYSLGALLYELLTGTTPVERERFRATAWEEFRRIIRDEDPPPPSARLSARLLRDGASESSEPGATRAAARATVRRLEGELDWIVLKALEKDRTRRYDTAIGFAGDVQRHLDGEPVSAAPPSAGYRVRKFARRHRTAIAAAAALALLLLAGVAGTTWGLLQARAAERTAIDARNAESLRADGEAKAKAEAEKRLDQLEKGNEVLGAIFDDVDVTRVKLSGEPLEAALGRRLRKAAKDLEGDALGDPAAVAKLQSRLGATLGGLGFPTEGLELRRKAFETIRRLQGEDTPDAIRAKSGLAAAYRETGRPDLATPMLEEAWKHYRQSAENDDPEALAVMNELAAAYKDVGRPERALPLYKEALERFTAKLGPKDPVTLRTSGALAATHAELGDGDLAYDLFRQAFERQREALGPDHYETLVAMSALANAMKDGARREGSAAFIEDNFVRHQKALGVNHPATFASLRTYAWSLRESGRGMQVFSLLDDAMRRASERLGPDHPETLALRFDLGVTYDELGDAAKALPLFEQSTERFRATLGPDHPETIAKSLAVAGALSNAGRAAEALKLYEGAVGRRRKKLGADHPETLLAEIEWGSALFAAGKRDAALAMHEDVRRRTESRFGAEHPRTAYAMNQQAITLRSMERFGEAMPIFEESVRRMSKALGPKHQQTLRAKGNLAATFWSLGRLDKSTPLFEELVARQTELIGRGHRDTLRNLANLGVNYRDGGRHAEAVRALREVTQAAAIMPDLRWVEGELLTAYARAGMKEEVVALSGRLAAVSRGTRRDDASLAMALNLLGVRLLEVQAGAEAEKLLRESLALREKAMTDDWLVGYAKGQVGTALLAQRRLAEAEPLLSAGCEMMLARRKSMPPQGPSALVDAMRRLVRLYEESGDKTKATKWRAELANWTEEKDRPKAPKASGPQT